MNKETVLVTGAAGFLGSAVIATLVKKYHIYALDQRLPNLALVKATPGVKWEQINISDPGLVNQVFQLAKNIFGKIDFVIHLAAFYHFGSDWRKEYERTNIRGTKNIISASAQYNIRRIVFASSIAAMEPPFPGQKLTEKSLTSHYLPYAKSKSIGENLFKGAVNKLPAIVLRFGGVFSDWCELPPLFSLIKLWSAYGFPGRIMPGNGESGIPYIHRSDAVRLMERCLELHDKLEPWEIFLASQNGVVLHKDIFAVIKQTLVKNKPSKPIHLTPEMAKIALRAKLALGTLIGKPPYERPWMLDFLDRPWVVDTSTTKIKLKWSCSPDANVLECLPLMLQRFTEQRNTWLERNIQRNLANYTYLAN